MKIPHVAPEVTLEILPGPYAPDQWVELRASIVVNGEQLCNNAQIPLHMIEGEYADAKAKYVLEELARFAGRRLVFGKEPTR